MKSPFPGMDPYLEPHWEDVHAALIGYIRDELQPQLSDDLVARMEEKVYVEDDTQIRLRKPDVRIAEIPSSWQPEPGQLSTAVLDEPVLLEPLSDPIRERSVQIYDAAGNRIITAIEILSPWNKSPGKAVVAYLQKREKYLDSDINLIEIDLVRTGDWTQMIGLFSIPKPQRTTYRVTVSEAAMHRPWHYAISLRGKLPTIKVPLRPQDTPATLNLQGLIEKAYQMGKYYKIDYSQLCDPPLEPEDQLWAEGLVRERD